MIIDDKKAVARRLARRRLVALATPATLAVLLLSLAASSGARALASGLLRDAHAIYTGARNALTDNHRAHQRRPATVAAHHAVAGFQPASDPRPSATGPSDDARPASPAADTVAVAPAAPSAPAPATPPSEPTPPPQAAPPPPTKRGVEPPPAQEPEPPSAEAPEPPQIDPAEPAEPAEPPAEAPVPPPAEEPEPPPAQEPEPPPAEQPEPPPAEQPEPPPTQEPEPRPAGTEQPFFDGARIRDFDLIQAAPGAITEVPDPLGSGETVLRMTVDDGDVAPVTPTDNPRAQALSPDLVNAGDEFWLKTKFLIPRGFPIVSGWLSLLSVYGPPFNGSSPWQVEVVGNSLRWMRDRAYGFDVPWQEPLRKGVWVSVLLHERFATDGFVEMWVDGQPVSFFGRETKLEMRTMDASNDGGANAAKIMQYREAGMFETGTVYFGPLLLGATRESVGG